MAINYSLYIDWIGTSEAWFDGAEAVWIPRGAINADAALVDLTGNGNDLTYDEYDRTGWNAKLGWAGVDGEYFDTGITPTLNQTIYLAVTAADTLDNFATAIGVRETISGTIRGHFIRMQGASDSASSYSFENVNYNDSRQTTAVIAINKNGYWVDGAEVSAQSITNNYAFTQSMFLGAMNLNGNPTQYLTDGYIAAVCIVNATDDDDTIALRTYALRNIINTNIIFPFAIVGTFEDRLLSYSINLGNRYYLSPTGKGFEPKAIGRATFVLDNTDNELDPRNSGSSLYGYIEPGKLIRLKVYQFPNANINLFSGMIDNITLDRHNKTATVQCVDSWGWLNNQTPETDLYQDITADEAIKAILDAVQFPKQYRGSDGYIYEGVDTIPYWWAKGGTAKKEIEDVVNAGLGFINFSGSGDPVHYSRRTPLVTVTRTEDLYNKQILLSEPWETRRNIVDIRVPSREEMAADTIWEYAETKRLVPGETFEIWAFFRYEGETLPANDVQAPTVNFNGLESGLGDDLSSGLTVDYTTYANKMRIRCTNDSGVVGHIVSASITGNPISTKGISKVLEYAKGWNTTPKTLLIENDWIQDYNTGKGFAKFILQYLGREHPNITLKQHVNFNTLFEDTGIFSAYNTLARPVALDIDTYNIDANYRLIGIQYVTGTTPQDVTVTYSLMPDYNEAGVSFFTLDSSLLDGSDILAW